MQVKWTYHLSEFKYVGNHHQAPPHSAYVNIATAIALLCENAQHSVLAVNLSREKLVTDHFH